jgi:hypothetical protein
MEMVRSSLVSALHLGPIEISLHFGRQLGTKGMDFQHGHPQKMYDHSICREPFLRGCSVKLYLSPLLAVSVETSFCGGAT